MTDWNDPKTKALAQAESDRVLAAGGTVEACLAAYEAVFTHVDRQAPAQAPQPLGSPVERAIAAREALLAEKAARIKEENENANNPEYVRAWQHNKDVQHFRDRQRTMNPYEAQARAAELGIEV